MQIKIMKCHYTFIRIAKNILKGKKRTYQGLVKMWNRSKLLILLMSLQTDTFIQKVKYSFIIQPSRPTPSICPKKGKIYIDMKNLYSKNVYLFIIIKT